MKIRTLLLSLFAIGALDSVNANSNDSTIIDEINASGVITVSLPDGLANKLVVKAEESSEVTTPKVEDESSQQVAVRIGYRVRIFEDNNPNSAQKDAHACKKQIEERFPELTAYVQFNSPYWSVKVGDFKTRSEAEVAMESIREEFTEYSAQIRVIRDRINSDSNE